MHKAIAVIHDEHRALAAVLHGLRHVCADMAARGTPPNFELLWAMLTYIDRFPERLHHPKEDQYLFRLLRQRAPQAHELLARLEREHREGARLIAGLHQALADLQEGVGPADAADLARLVERFCDFHWRHMRAEEDEILPLAERALGEAEWRIIDDAFAANDDPLVGVDSKDSFKLLFKRIVNLAPPPYGVGPPADEDGGR